MNKWISKLNGGWWQYVILVALLVVMNIGMEELTDHGITGAEVLFIRSICNLLAAFVMVIYSGKSAFPNHPKLQLVAFISSGLSILLIYIAYQYLTAGSVSTLQRLDIPILVLVSAFSTRLSWQQIVLALLSFILVAALVTFNKSTSEEPIGYIIVLAAVVIISISSLVQKRIASIENIQTIISITSLSSLFWSSVRCWQSNAKFVNVHWDVFFVIVALSICNLIIFFIVTDLYKKHNAEVVRYPYLVAAFFTILTEMIVEHTHTAFSSVLIIGNTLILIVLTLLVRDRQLNISTSKAEQINT